MKKLFCIVLVMIVNFSTVPLPVMAQPPGTMVVGMVSTLHGNPVPGIKILAKDPAARVISEAVTDVRGRYALPNLAPDRYQLTLDPLNSPYKGQTLVSAVGNEGLTVNWMVSQTTVALATAAPGVSEPPSPGTESQTTGVLIFLGGAGGLFGLAAGLGAFHQSTASGSQ